MNEVVEIPLTRGFVALVSPEDAEWIKQFKWCARPQGNLCYACRKKPGTVGTHLHMHREIMKPPPDMEIDHIDHNGLNNTRGNLRICTRAQNAANMRPPRKEPPPSGYRGVYSVPRNPKKPWMSAIKKQQKLHHLGYFETTEEAARAYDAAALEHFGEFAVLNFPRTYSANRLQNAGVK